MVCWLLQGYPTKAKVLEQEVFSNSTSSRFIGDNSILVKTREPHALALYESKTSNDVFLYIAEAIDGRHEGTCQKWKVS